MAVATYPGHLIILTNDGESGFYYASPKQHFRGSVEHVFLENE